MCEGEKPLKIGIVLIVAGLGTVLVIGGLIFNCKSKNLNYKNIEGNNETNR